MIHEELLTEKVGNQPKCYLWWDSSKIRVQGGGGGEDGRKALMKAKRHDDRANCHLDKLCWDGEVQVQHK